MSKPVRENLEIDLSHNLPVLPLKVVVFFPYMLYPLLVGREVSMRAIHEAMMGDKLIFLTVQKELAKEDPGKEDLYRIGVVARILQVLKLPNGLLKVLVEGLVRGRITRFQNTAEYLEVRVEAIPDHDGNSLEVQAALRRVLGLFREYVHLNRNLPEEALLAAQNFEKPHQVVDYVAAQIQREAKIKQQVLEITDVLEQLLFLAELLEDEKQILEAERTLDDKVRGRVQRTQRNFWLQEQMRAIQEELGDEGESDSDIAGLRERVKKAAMPKAAEEKANEELDRLKHTAMFSPEATVIRNYVDWLASVPWNEKTEDQLDLGRAKQILEEDHYGLEKPKERILEHLAVLKLVQKMKGPILCFVGPPGVGKTSLAKSIARAMGRNFVRISLGGVRDEADIRGHRRTYIGSMPGRIIQSMKRAKSVNPVFLLDEIDKMSNDYRGDPAAALLEVLDPEQNQAFNDHYLEVDYDLSQALFITTANVRAQIPEPLQDRMEIINLPGYLEHEKLGIAKGFLVPKLLREHGLAEAPVKFSDKAILKIIREYTREAGVRNLEREMSTVCRKAAYDIVETGATKKSVLTPHTIEKCLGVVKYPQRPVVERYSIGVATGLAWTRYGGDIIEIEVSLMPGKGNLTLTGKLGDVMKESARAAFSYARTHAEKLGIAQDFWKDNDIHLHIPEGSIPKDGPSAGITLAAALVSASSGRPLRRDIALTGELTLRGTVLAIGGLNEKMLAAQRLGIRTVIIPQENMRDLKELPAELRKGVEVILVKHIEEVLGHVLCEKSVLNEAMEESKNAAAIKSKTARKQIREQAEAIN
jgi:ATP-dependent Lon protease